MVDRHQIEYFVFGDGKRNLLAFNGYGQDASELSILNNHIPDSRIISINIPFHGLSKPQNNPEEPMKLDEWKNIITEIIDQEKVNEFGFFGYSLGAKLALSLLIYNGLNAKELILFAPDGLRRDKWYNLTVSTKLSRMIFNKTVDHPGWFFFLINGLKYLGIIDTSLHKFIHLHFGDPAQRLKVYSVWTHLRCLHPNLRKIKQMIREENMEVQIFFGKYDKVIPPRSGRSFLKGIEANCKLKILGAGHHLITDKHLKFVK